MHRVNGPEKMAPQFLFKSQIIVRMGSWHFSRQGSFGTTGNHTSGSQQKFLFRFSVLTIFVLLWGRWGRVFVTVQAMNHRYRRLSKQNLSASAIVGQISIAEKSCQKECACIKLHFPLKPSSTSFFLYECVPLNVAHNCTPVIHFYF